MPTLDWKLKTPYEDAQEIFVRGDTAGTVRIVAANGSFKEITIDPTVEDGTAAVKIEHVTEGMAFSIFYLEALVGTGAFNLLPAVNDWYSIVGVSCFYNLVQRDAPALRHAANEPRLKLLCDQGDSPYKQVTPSSPVFGVSVLSTLTDLATANSLANHNAWEYQQLQTPALKLIGHRACVIDQSDDHEWLTDDYTGKLSDVNAELTAAGAGWQYSSQSQVDVAHITCMQSIRAYSKGNPQWDTPLTQAPPHSTLPDSQYLLNYSVLVVGSVLVVTLDNIGARAGLNEDGSMLGSVQWAQMQADVAAADVKFVLINSSKGIMQLTGSNNDGWTQSAPTEEALIIQWMNDVAETGKGIVMMTGDDHISAHTESTSPDATCIYGCSISQDVKTSSQRTPTENTVVWMPDFGNAYWKWEVQGEERVKVSVVNDLGKEYVFGYLYPGSALLERG